MAWAPMASSSALLSGRRRRVSIQRRSSRPSRSPTSDGAKTVPNGVYHPLPQLTRAEVSNRLIQLYAQTRKPLLP